METLLSLKWQIFALAEFITIVFIVRKNNSMRKKSLVTMDLNEYKRTDVNMNDLMKDLHLSKSLYKVLTRKYHPDKFIGTMNVIKAQEIFKEIQENKTNYRKLSELEEKAESELNLK